MIARYLAQMCQQYEQQELRDGLQDAIYLLTDIREGDLKVTYGETGKPSAKLQRQLLEALVWIQTALDRL